MDRDWMPTTQSIERVSGRSQEREFSMQRQGDKISDFGTFSTAETVQTKKQGTQVFDNSDVLRVSPSHHNYREWLIETVDIELAAHHAVIETGLLLRQEREFSGQRRRIGIGLFCTKF
jgi:hypothetical protein